MSMGRCLRQNVPIFPKSISDVRYTIPGQGQGLGLELGQGYPTSEIYIRHRI